MDNLKCQLCGREMVNTSINTDEGSLRWRCECGQIRNTPMRTNYLDSCKSQLEHCKEVADGGVVDIIATVRGGAELEPCVQRITKKLLHMSTVLDQVLRGWQ